MGTCYYGRCPENLENSILYGFIRTFIRRCPENPLSEQRILSLHRKFSLLSLCSESSLSFLSEQNSKEYGILGKEAERGILDKEGE